MGKPMVVRTWEQARKAKTLDRVVIATDDERIADVCRKAGAEVIMTSNTCPNGEHPYKLPFCSLHVAFRLASCWRYGSKGLRQGGSRARQGAGFSNHALLIVTLTSNLYA